MFCRKCGCDIGDDKFCSSCGAEQIDDAGQRHYPQPVKGDMSIGDWIIALLISIIPIVGLVVLLVWAFGDAGDKPSRKNWALAQLILVGALIIISIVFVVVTVALAPKS